MQEILSKDIINHDLVPLLSVGKRGSKIKLSYYQIINLILYKLKTGCQWAFLPIKSFIKMQIRLIMVFFIIFVNGQKMGVGQKFGRIY